MGVFEKAADDKTVDVKFAKAKPAETQAQRHQLDSNLKALDNVIKQKPRDVPRVNIYANGQKVLRSGNESAIFLMNKVVEMAIGDNIRGSYTIKELVGASARIAGTKENQGNISDRDFGELAKITGAWNKFENWVKNNPDFTENQKRKLLEDGEEKYREALRNKDSSVILEYMKTVMPKSEFEAISSTIAAAMAMSVNDVQQFFQNRLQNERDRLTESAQETGDSKQETQPSGGGSEEGSPSPVSGEKDKENSDNHKDILASLVKKTVKEDNARTAKAAKKKGAG